VDTLAELHGFYQDAQLPMRAVAFAPIGNQLAVGGDDGLIRLWSNGLVCQQSIVTAQDPLCVDVPLRFRAHTAPVRSISWSPDEHYLATGGDDGMIAIWDTPPGRIPTLVTKTPFVDPVVAINWSPVGKQIAVASGKTVTIWNMGK
jgi:WD40 repeat protein